MPNTVSPGVVSGLDEHIDRTFNIAYLMELLIDLRLVNAAWRPSIAQAQWVKCGTSGDEVDTE